MKIFKRKKTHSSPEFLARKETKRQVIEILNNRMKTLRHQHINYEQRRLIGRIQEIKYLREYINKVL